MKRLKNTLSLTLVLALVLSLSLTYASAAEPTFDNAQSFIDLQLNTDADAKNYTDNKDPVVCYNPYWENTSSTNAYTPFERDTTITVTYLPGVDDTGNEISEPFVWVALFPYRQQADGSYVSVVKEDNFGNALPYILTVDGTFEPLDFAWITPGDYSVNGGSLWRGLAPGESVTFTIPFDELGDDLLYEVQVILSFNWQIDDLSGYEIADSSWKYERIMLDNQAAQPQQPQYTAENPKVDDWAVGRYTEAKGFGLLPTDGVLGSDYTVKITRAQFAALAVTTYEKAMETTVPTSTGDDIFADCTGNEYVAKAYNLGILSGYNSAATRAGVSVGPNDFITREQAAVMLTRMMTKYNDVTGGYPLAKAENLPFTDTASSWALDSIATVYEHGIMAGTSATTFDGKANYTIQQAIVTMYRYYDWVGRGVTI